MTDLNTESASVLNKKNHKPRQQLSEKSSSLSFHRGGQYIKNSLI